MFRKTDRAVSVILKGITVIAAVLGVFLSAGAGRGSFMGGNRVFMYFTIQSNIAVALIAAVGLVLLLRGKKIADGWYVVKWMGAVSITLTGAVFCFVLAPTFGAYAWNAQNVLTHVVVPVTAVADFFVTGIYGNIPKKIHGFCHPSAPRLRRLRGDRLRRGLGIRAGRQLPLLLPELGQPGRRLRLFQ